MKLLCTTAGPLNWRSRQLAEAVKGRKSGQMDERDAQQKKRAGGNAIPAIKEEGARWELFVGQHDRVKLAPVSAGGKRKRQGLGLGKQSGRTGRHHPSLCTRLTHALFLKEVVEYILVDTEPLGGLQGAAPVLHKVRHHFAAPEEHKAGAQHVPWVKRLLCGTRAGCDTGAGG